MISYPEVQEGEVEVRISGLLVSVVPLGEREASWYSLSIEYRSKGKYAIARMGEVLDRDGNWQYEMRPSSRTDEHIEATRYSLEEALGIARRVAPTLSVNGITAAEWVARRVDNG